ncbi:MAG: RsmB/NOP family class I SAM-dependent RNA methyltransferase [Bdellovibrionaceae bacterium]|nr:RsmB/NOP family class I SAM-dependent RNA methyltransferase [Bdellovibrio sp.]
MNSPLSNLLFEKYFEKIYGDRWPQLKQSLFVHEKQILRKNLFVDVDSAKLKDLEPAGFLPDAYWKPEGYALQKNANGLYDFYVMDPASAIVARALEVCGADKVLDLCAAPGGKTLILAEQMSLAESSGVSGTLISNEMSEGRRERLMRVLHEYIPKEQRLFISVKGLDGNQYGLRNAETYDRILADVPCSGERHLFENQKEFALWTERRTKNLAVRQYSLLSSAWLALKPGGRIVYSTCSISPEENDAVIAKLIKKREPIILRPEWLDKIKFLEKTLSGYQILPDRAGFGPMYFAVIEKPNPVSV